MKRAWMLTLVALTALAGCQVTEATLTGHDFIDKAAANFRVGIDEYHADDLERMRQVRARLAAAFAADVVALAADPDVDRDAVQAKTAEFLAALEAAEAAENVEETRYQNLLNTLRAVLEVNDSLRDLAQVKLGWRDAAIQYADKLRKAVRDGSTRSGD